MKRIHWIVKFPDQLSVDETIVHNQIMYKIIKLTDCCGAGSMEFGEYWSVKATRISDGLIETFWIYDNEPIPTIHIAKL